MEFRDEFFGFFEKQIEQHKNEVKSLIVKTPKFEFDYDVEESTDYVEAYLKEKRRRETVGDFESFWWVQMVRVSWYNLVDLLSDSYIIV